MQTQYPVNIISGVLTFISDCWNIIEGYDTLTVGSDTVTNNRPVVVEELIIAGGNYIAVIPGYGTVSVGSTLPMDTVDVENISYLIIT